MSGKTEKQHRLELRREGSVLQIPIESLAWGGIANPVNSGIE